MNQVSAFSAVEQFIVIDDDPSTLYLCKIIIQRLFEKLSNTTFNKPKNAVNYFQTTFSEHPVSTVVLLDINMPMLSGWEVLDELYLLKEEVKEKIIVIMLSSSIDPADKQKAFAHPLVFDYVEKPLTISRFSQIMGLIKDAINNNFSELKNTESYNTKPM